MAIPAYDALFPNVLHSLQDGQEKKLKDLRSDIAAQLNLSDEELSEMLPSKTSTVFNSRTHWAAYYLKRAGLVHTPHRDVYQMTDEGKRVIQEKGFEVSLNDLMNYESFRTFIQTKPDKPVSSPSVPVHPDSAAEISTPIIQEIRETPQDRMHKAFTELNTELADRLMVEIMSMSPRFFEKLVLDLLSSMGYGGRNPKNIIETPYSHDDGIDGLIKEDELGLDYVYVQAKRWSGTVGEPEIHKFVGALAGQGASKGVFITTSTFTAKAESFANRHLASKIVLVDGKRLTDLMITYGVGVAEEQSYKIQRVDSDYFTEDNT